MPQEETPDEAPPLLGVEITIVVPGHVRATLTKARASSRVRAGFGALGIIAAVVVATIIAASPSVRRGERSLIAHATVSDAPVTRFGIRLNCPRLTVVSPDGDYARVDFGELASPCGTYVNHLTLILHRVQGSWAPEFEASGWTCPLTRLPRPIVTQLRLCR
jgi:hypothetical protein